ncbi:MAG: redox-regulated ATPase YchF [Candidatus Marinimicrobia bacterium]|nr:redox-regulated ATPase YchF [Candidatus Neomarinimicrobiota bacterium]
MGFSCGIVGLPNVGKSTIYRALTSADVTIEPYAFSTITPNTGIAQVPDERLDSIALIVNPERIVNTTLNFVDVAGLVEGAASGEGMGNQFLSHIRKVNAIAHVVRCFEDSNVPHISKELNPIQDIEIVELELILKDLETIGKRIEKTKKVSKAGDKEAMEEITLFEMVRDVLDEGTPVRNIEFDEEEQTLIDELFFLSAKPQLFVANIGESNIGDNDYELLNQVSKAAAERKSPIISLCSKLEAELSELESEEKAVFARELGILNSGLENLVAIGYEMLNLITFFTTRSNEVKAWTVKEGTTASAAAGKIHTDIEKGFIKADVIKYEDLMEFESESAVREKGLVMTAGRDYPVEDGDIIHFKFR